MSVRSYAALERGAANPSLGLVESVAAGLRMTPAERSALHVLATRQDPPMPATPPGGEWPQISPGLRDLITQLDPLPAAITDEMWTVMARNQALTALTSGWFDRVPRDQQNLVLFLFSPEGDRLLPEVHAHRQAAVAGLRYQYARNIASNRFAALIGALLDTGPEARDLWERHEIAMPQRQCSTRVRHPARGLMEARILMTLPSARTWLMLTQLPGSPVLPAQLLPRDHAQLSRPPPATGPGPLRPGSAAAGHRPGTRSRRHRSRFRGHLPGRAAARHSGGPPHPGNGSTHSCPRHSILHRTGIPPH